MIKKVVLFKYNFNLIEMEFWFWYINRNRQNFNFTLFLLVKHSAKQNCAYNFNAYNNFNGCFYNIKGVVY